MTSALIAAAKQTAHRAVYLVTLVGLFVGWLAIPASYWFEVDRVYVFDASENSTPLMEVDRKIHGPFRGEWIATVLRKNAGNGFSIFCTAHGGNDYDPTVVLPAPVDLNWWTWPTECRLPPGTYILKTTWVIHVPLMAEKTIRISSNVFRITPVLAR